MDQVSKKCIETDMKKSKILLVEKGSCEFDVFGDIYHLRLEFHIRHQLVAVQPQKVYHEAVKTVL